MSSDLRCGSGLRCILLAGRGFILCRLLPEGCWKPSVKLLLMETKRQSSWDPSRASEIDSIKVLPKLCFQHPLLKFQLDENNNNNNTVFRRRASCGLQIHLRSATSVCRESSQDCWWQGSHTPRNHHCNLHLNSGTPGTCPAGLILSETFGRDRLINRCGSEVTCGFHPESDFDGKERT